MFRQWIKKNVLVNAFKIADISYTYKEKKSFPYVVDIREDDEVTKYIFKLPRGLDPVQLEKKEYIFNQTFGNAYTLEGDGLAYELTVFSNEVDHTFKYNWLDIAPLLDDYSLPIVVGKDVLGKIHVYNMVTNPHLLIAGETGSGKSVCVRSIITTILLHCRDRVDLYLGDMKRSEFHVFRNVQGVQAVMTKMNDLHKCLNWLKGEMERRGDLLDMWEVEHIDEYNKIAKDKEKYIVLAIDEVALLKKEKDLMDIVEQVSCIGRALGVFLILSMQRPDSKVLEGQLKNNLTVRYAFRHSDRINSNITLGQGSSWDASTIGSNESGRFIYKSETTRMIQAPFLPLKDARKLLEPYKSPQEAKDVSEAPQTAYMELPTFEEGEQ